MSGQVVGVRTMDFPDLGAVTDDTSFVVDHLGTGRVLATAVTDYVSLGFVTAAALAAEAAARQAMISPAMAHVVSATSLGVALTALGASATGSALFTVPDTTTARTDLGATVLGAQLFTADTPAHARGFLGIVTTTGLSNTRLVASPGNTVNNAWNGATVTMTGPAFFTLFFAGAANYDPNFMVLLLNEDMSRAKLISLAGVGTFMLWPGQTCIVFASNNQWKVVVGFQRWAKPSAVFYVDPALGSDLNDGLAAGAGNAFLTIQGAYSVMRNNLDCQGTPPTMTLQDGTHQVGAGVNINYPLVGASQLFINGSGPANVLVTCLTGGNSFNARDLSTVTLSGMTLGTTGNGSSLISASQGATIDLNNVNFNAAPLGNHIMASTWASVNVLSGYAVNGGANTHVNSTFNAYINYGSFNVSGAASLAFNYFATAGTGGIINAGGVPMTFTGFSGVTGQKFIATGNGQIVSSTTVYPGSIAGTTATGGQYS